MPVTPTRQKIALNSEGATYYNHLSTITIMLITKTKSLFLQLILTTIVAGFSTCLAQSTPLSPSDHPLSRPIEGALELNSTESETISEERQLTRINFTSQVWRNIQWKHDLALIKPTKACTSWLYLHLGASRIHPKNEEYIKTLSARTGIATAFISQIPNQPLFDNKREDDLLSYTLSEYVKTNDSEWPILSPMVRSVSRAIDLIESQLSVCSPNQRVQVILGGASKRGWTTWLAGPRDARIKAIAPMVFEMINIRAQTQLAQQAYGSQSAQIKEYTNLGLTDNFDRPALKKIIEWFDPFSSINSYKMPKLLLLGTNDPYWVVNSSSLYVDRLPPPTSIYMVPNGQHGSWSSDGALSTLANFIGFTTKGLALPSVTADWSTNPQGQLLRIKPEITSQLSELTLLTATSSTLDFRDSKWHSSPIGYSNSGTSTLLFPKQQSVNLAVIAQAKYDTEFGPLFLSSPVKVLPQ